MPSSGIGIIRFGSVVGICLRYIDDHVDQTSAKDRRKKKSVEVMLDFMSRAQVVVNELIFKLLCSYQ